MTVIISQGAPARAQASVPRAGKGITTYSGPSGGSVLLLGIRAARGELPDDIAVIAFALSPTARQP